MIWWVIFLFLAGMILVLAEFIVPGGIVGTFGVLLLLISGGMGVAYYPDYALLIVVSEFLGALVCVALGMLLLSRSGAAKFLKLSTTQNLEEGYVNAVSDTSLIGATGAVFSALRPAGAILVDGKRLDAVSAGTFIEKDTPVRIIEVHGNRVVVERVEQE